MDESQRLLISRIRSGEQQAWSELIAMFEGRLLAFVRSRLSNKAVAEDVVQETFMGFLVSLPNYDEATPLENFLFAIAGYKLTDVLRKQGRRPTVPLTPPGSQSRAPELPGSARMASSLIRSRERKTREEDVLAAELKELISTWKERGETERLKCMELLFVLGRPNKVAAKELAITEQAVANHKHYTVTKLKEAATRARLSERQLAEFGID